MPRPKVDCIHHHAVLAAPDVSVTIDFYVSKLGFDLDFTQGDPPAFAGVSLGGVQIHLLKGAPHPGDSDVYFLNLRDYFVRDLNGYVLGFGHYLMASEPKLEIERIDVPVRLEKRLAAVLEDLPQRRA